MACAAYGYLGEIMCQLETLGLLNVLLPFLLIFTIAFAVLQKSKIMGERSYRFNIIISFVLALAAIIPHVTGSTVFPDVVVPINKALPQVSLLMVASMMALLMIGVFGHNINLAGTSLGGVVVIFSLVAVVYTFLQAAGLTRRIELLADPQTRSLLIAILVFGIIVWFITSEPNEDSKGTIDSLKEFFEGFSTILGKKE